ncbi:hypothetical protein QUB75_04765 [Microcoleus sp. K1-B6]|uniref:hypothetical protein n=1 Tax=unclassified Microcoleus TaxID=2642155 RepID=UPI002FD289CE
MRKPTPGESVFLAGTLTASVLATVEIVPDVAKELAEDAQKTAQLYAEQKLVHPVDSFTAGAILGIVAGSAVTLKVIAEKMNNP